MELNRFDALVRCAAGSLSRRGVLGFAAIGFAGALGNDPASATKRNRRRNKNKNKNKKLQRNAFGCVDVGKPCRGDDANCCSGICDGKKPKKGKKDTSRCLAHDVGGCQADQDSCAADLEVPCGADGVCFLTTGNASFCAQDEEGDCFACARDSECEAEFGPGAACVVCAICEDIAGVSTACVPPVV